MALISKFVSEISASAGLAKKNRYWVVFSSPRVLQNIGYTSEELNRIIIMCDSIDIPGVTIRTSSSVSYVESREIPYKTDYDAIQATFYVDGNMLVKAFFDDWIKHIQNAKTRNFNYYDDYICPKMYILVEDLNDNVRYEVSLNEVYPKTVGKIGMGYANNDIMTLSVTLQYKNWSSRQILLGKEYVPGEVSDDNVNMFDGNFSLDNLVNDWNTQQEGYELMMAEDYLRNLDNVSPLEPVIPIK